MTFTGVKHGCGTTLDNFATVTSRALIKAVIFFGNAVMIIGKSLILENGDSQAWRDWVIELSLPRISAENIWNPV